MSSRFFCFFLVTFFGLSLYASPKKNTAKYHPFQKRMEDRLKRGVELIYFAENTGAEAKGCHVPVFSIKRRVLRAVCVMEIWDNNSHNSKEVKIQIAFSLVGYEYELKLQTSQTDVHLNKVEKWLVDTLVFLADLSIARNKAFPGHGVRKSKWAK